MIVMMKVGCSSHLNLNASAAVANLNVMINAVLDVQYFCTPLLPPLLAALLVVRNGPHGERSGCKHIVSDLSRRGWRR